LFLTFVAGVIFYFMARKCIPKSFRKFIRKEKARIRREVFDLKKQEELINELYEKITTKKQ